MPNKIVVAITGASGALYAKALLDSLKQIPAQYEAVGIIMSDNAKIVWAQYNIMFVVPCSMGTLGRIAAGISDDLTTRAADVILKERRKLILVAREAPYNLIHIRNMETVTLAGGIICPATPSFYSVPKTLEEVAMTVVSRMMDLAGLDIKTYRWSTK
jgi:4-hydroxy-3-polyprenylbenzoate decarboxylase